MQKLHFNGFRVHVVLTQLWKKTDAQKIEKSSVVLFRRLKDAVSSGESTRKKDIPTIFQMR